jgi:hypothetical protein
MLQLIYTSEATSSFDDAELASVLATSRRRNRTCQVTGLLLAADGRFLQALEGPYMAVRDTFARIEADPRHRTVETIARREVPMRDFGTWSMAYPGEGEDLDTTAARLIALLDDPGLTALFSRFVDESAQLGADSLDRMGGRSAA